MAWKQYSLMSLRALSVVFLVMTWSTNALAEGFADKRVRFDGRVTKGELDEKNNLSFSGLGKWGSPFTVRFSPIVRTQFGLAPFIETEVGNVLGAYSVTFTFFRKVRGVTYQNLRIGIIDREGNELASNGMVSRSGSDWVIGIATEAKPFEIHISYSAEKESKLTPAQSPVSDDL